MPNSALTTDDLNRILIAAAGADDGVALVSESLETPFEDLGYDSLALLEAGSLIQREYGVVLDDETLADVQTPSDLIGLVNDRITADASA